ncbi:hypothetical protein ALC53_01371 [Atta colombica]|uniref:Uncharacterized protein n=1 Tax=Atta colombica TaxID=520822 RepID=A0A195BVN2_9HYME|nr:hypothetical protein ALC53_01371 [Atta colombica]
MPHVKSKSFSTLPNFSPQIFRHHACEKKIHNILEHILNRYLQYILFHRSSYRFPFSCQLLYICHYYCRCYLDILDTVYNLDHNDLLDNNALSFQYRYNHIYLDGYLDA